jgi:amino acid transporter
VALAAIVTVLEVATLVVVAIAGAPLLADPEVLARVLTPPADPVALSTVAAAALIAFFAFIGFEDIENMAEETVDPRYVMPRAILLTLAITVAIYAVLALIAVALPDRDGLTASAAPLAFLFEQVSGRSGAPIAAMASIAMVNGILVQIVMASRVLYGMAREGLVPAGLGVLDPRRRTPARAIALVAVLIAALALFLPIVNLAQAASALVLCVFTMVNVSLWRIGGRADADPSLRRWRWWGMLGAILSVGLLVAEGARLAGLHGAGGTIVH